MTANRPSLKPPGSVRGLGRLGGRSTVERRLLLLRLFQQAGLSIDACLRGCYVCRPGKSQPHEQIRFPGTCAHSVQIRPHARPHAVTHRSCPPQISVSARTYGGHCCWEADSSPAGTAYGSIFCGSRRMTAPRSSLGRLQPASVASTLLHAAVSSERCCLHPRHARSQRFGGARGGGCKTKPLNCTSKIDQSRFGHLSFIEFLYFTGECEQLTNGLPRRLDLVVDSITRSCFFADQHQAPQLIGVSTRSTCGKISKIFYRMQNYVGYSVDHSAVIGGSMRLREFVAFAGTAA